MKSTLWLPIFLCLAVLALPVLSGAEVTTSRDDKGVWFIEGAESDSLHDVFQKMGYAVATDRLWQMEKYRRSANGTLAAIFGAGKDNEYLNQDILVRVTGYSDTELEEGFNALDAEARSMIQGYVDGVNLRIAEVTANPALLPYEFHALGRKLGLESALIPRDWTPEDVLAWEATLLRQFDPGAQARGQLDNARLIAYLQAAFGESTGAAMFNDLRWTNDPDAQTYIPGNSSGAQAAANKSKPVNVAANAAAATTTEAESEAEAGAEAGAEKTANGMPKTAGMSKGPDAVENMWAERVDTLKKINAYVKMGSYAWVISGDKTASGRPTIYSGPQMGFSVPVICQEGSIEAAGLKVSGMTIPGLPGIVIGRTPHHAWSMQVGHAHTVDYYFENPSDVSFHRMETIEVAGGADVNFPVYRSDHGPIISPRPYNPSTYEPAPDNPIVAWRYSHWGEEFETLKAFLNLARAESMDAFGEALRNVAVSQHFCYADRDGNIAYWMSGMDPVRPEGYDYRFPQGINGSPQAEWDDGNLQPLSSDRNTSQGFYCGWNNKSSQEVPNNPNNPSYYLGPFHRAHVLEKYLQSRGEVSFEQIRDLALHIATTDSIGRGGNPWAFVEDPFRRAVKNNATEARSQALAIMEDFDGHFVAGGESNWAAGKDRSDAWMLANTWIQEVIDLTFTDELGNANSGVYDPKAASADNNVYDADTDNAEKWDNPLVLFNVILHSLDADSALTNNYNWFDNLATPDTVEDAEWVIVTALDRALAALGSRPWGAGERGMIAFEHPLLGEAANPLHKMPFSSRSTYAHCVEMGGSGPERIASMFPLGQSGTILADASGEPDFDENFFSMTAVFDPFAYRDFPVFAGDDDDHDDDTCFIESLR